MFSYSQNNLCVLCIPQFTFKDPCLSWPPWLPYFTLQRFAVPNQTQLFLFACLFESFSLFFLNLDGHLEDIGGYCHLLLPNNPKLQWRQTITIVMCTDSESTEF
jgi:hypothetical protein